MLANFLSTFALIAGFFLGGAYLPGQAGVNSPALCPASIGFGETVTCNIASAGEIDSYTFTASAGDRVQIRMSRSSSSLNPRVILKDTDGSTTLCEAYSSYTAEIESCALVNGGTYTIRAQGGYSGTDTGDYYLYLQRLNNPGNPVAIAFGQTLAGAITTQAEMDTYTFDAATGDKVLVRMSNTSGSLGPQIKIFNPDGSPSTCEGSSSSTAEITSCALNSTGSYVLQAGDYQGTSTGDYKLFLQRLNNPGNSVPIAFGETLAGAITSQTEMDAYTFDATTGDKVLVRMIKKNGELWPEISIYGPDGIIRCTEYSSYTAEIASCPLNTTGTYTLLAGDGFQGVYTGDYALYLQRMNNPGSPVTLTFGQALAGSITSGKVDTYVFDATAGDKVLVRMSKKNGSLGPQVRLFGVDGTSKLCENYSSTTAEITSCPLYDTGTYILLAHDGYPGTNIGDYGLYLQRLNNPGNATPISFGQTLTSALTTAAEMDAYTFTAAAGAKVYASIRKSSGSLWPGIRIYAPDGTQMCEEYGYNGADINNCPLTTTGTHTILAYDGYNGTYTGGYSIRYGNKVTLNSIALQDGWVLETAENSTKGGKLDAKAKTFQLGDDALNRQYRAILSFDTTALPSSAVIQTATLRIRPSGAPVGLDPFKFLKPLLLEIAYSYFGTKNTLEAMDFQAGYAARKVGTFIKKADGWYSANLTAAGITNINKYGLTQFRLYFTKDDNNNRKADYQKFFSGNNPINKPQLVIVYTVP